MRLFVGIPLAEETREELAALEARLRARAPKLRWSKPGLWHVTLQFLGHASAEQHEAVKARLAEVSAAPVPIELEQLSCFERAGVLHLGVRLTPQLVALQQRVTRATGQCGFAPEERAYQPHITLARSRRNEDRRKVAELAKSVAHSPRFTRFVAHAFVLHESFPGPAGSRYEVRARYVLNAE
jgi:2'-5' RNA ligase